MSPSEVSARPRFSWDMKSPLWTDGKGSQESYYESVLQWKKFHDTLLDTNNNKVPAALQGLVLLSQLYGRAKDLAKKVSEADLSTDDGALRVAEAIHKTDALSIVTDVYERFSSVLATKRSDNESLKNFETRFDAQVSKLHSITGDKKLPDSLVSFILLNNSNIENNQRVTVLASCAPKGNDATENVLESIKYDEIASILRSSDSPAKSDKPALSAHSVKTKHGFRYQPRHTDIAELKKKTKCKECKKKGHWAGDPECELTKKNDQNQAHPPQNANGNANGNAQANGNGKPKALHFHMANFSDQIEEAPGPMVDDGAPYSGIGIQELANLFESINCEWNGKLNPIPKTVRATPFWQYGSGSHSSKPRPILGPVDLQLTSDQGNPVTICHLVIEGSSPWVIRKNVTKHCDIIHSNGNLLRFGSDSISDTVQLFEHDNHSYISMVKFYIESVVSAHHPRVASLCASSAGFATKMSFDDSKKVVDRVHKHVCGHSNYEDISLLLKRNHIWSDDISHYLGQILNTVLTVIW